MNKKITNNMTVISKKSFKEATVKLHSAEEAVNYLRTDLITRNVRSNLEKLTAGQDIKTVQKILVSGLLENHPEMKKDSVERRVRGWLDPNSVHSLKKEDAIEIAFILHSSIDKADEFISLVSEEKLHWRSPEEIVYIYGLEHGFSYRDCSSILDLPEIQKVLQQSSDYRKLEEISPDGYTEFIQAEIEKIHSNEELISYLQNNYTRLGYLHNTAYEMFMEMIGRLESPAQKEEALGILDEAPEKYTIRDILTEFFYQDSVLSAKQKAVKAKKDVKQRLISKDQQYTLDLIQKTIADNWPDEVTISKMKNRSMDVARKSLILLFMATDGDYEDDYDFDYEVDEREIFEDILERLNDMLFFCGYSPLDPRNPFDWLIIYCIYVEDMFDIDPRLKSLLEELFRRE